MDIHFTDNQNNDRSQRKGRRFHDDCTRFLQKISPKITCRDAASRLRASTGTLGIVSVIAAPLQAGISIHITL